MKDIGIAIGQKWMTRAGDIVVIVLDEKDDQPFQTSNGTWHFRDGMMWRHKQCGGDLIKRVDDEESKPEYTTKSTWREFFDRFRRAWLVMIGKDDE